MTTTLMCSALLGAAVSYPLLKKTAQFDEELTVSLKRLVDLVTIPLALTALGLLFFLYGPMFAALMLLAAVIAGVFPRFVLVGFGVIAFSSQGIGFSWLLVLFSIIFIWGRNFTDFHLQRPLRNYSWQGVALFAAATILLAETILFDAGSGFLTVSNPAMVASIGGKRAIPILADGLAQKDMRNSAQRELRKYGRAVVPALLDRVDKYDLDARRAAAEIIVNLNEARAMRDYGEQGTIILVSGLTSTSDAALTDRNETGLSFWESSSSDFDGSIITDEKAVLSVSEVVKPHLHAIGKSALPHLLAVLRRREIGAQSQADVLSVLRVVGGQRVLPQVLPAFIARDSEGRHSRDELILTELAKFGTEAIPQFIAALQSEDRWQRWWAQEALVKIGEKAAPDLKTLLQAKPQMGQAEAAIALGSIRDYSALPLLLAKLDDPNLQEAVIWSLGVLGDKRAAAALVALDKKAPDPNILRSLGQIGGETALSYLTNALLSSYRTNNTALHDATHKALQKDNWSFELRTAIHQLHDYDNEVRKQAAATICQFDADNLLPILKEADVAAHDDSGQCHICEAIRLYTAN